MSLFFVRQRPLPTAQAFFETWTRRAFHTTPFLAAKSSKSSIPFYERHNRTADGTKREAAKLKDVKNTENKSRSKARLEELKKVVSELPHLTDIYMTQTLLDLVSSDNVKYLVPFFRYFCEKSPQEITPDMIIIIIQSLNKHKEHALIESFIRELLKTQTEYPFTLECQREIFNYLAANKQFDKLIMFLDDLKSKGFPEQSLNTEALKVLGNLGYLQEMDKLYQSLLAKSSNIDPQVHRTVLYGYAQAIDVQGLLSSFERLISSKYFEKDIKTYNLVLDSLSRIGEPEQVDNFYERILSDSLIPDQVSYCSLVRCYSRHNLDTKLDDAIRSLKSQEPLTVKSWNTILAAWKDRDLLRFLENYLELRKKEVKPDYHTSLLVENLLSKTPLKDVLLSIDKVANKLNERGEEDPRSTLLTVLLHGISSLSTSKTDLTQLLQEIRTQGLSLKGSALNALLVGLVNTGLTQELLSVFEEQGQPDVVSYAVVIGALVKNKRYDEMVSVIRRLLRDPNISEEHRTQLRQQVAVSFDANVPSSAQK